MTLTTREKCAVAISHAMILYSYAIKNGKNMEQKSIIDFIVKNMPQELKTALTMELIDDVIQFTANSHMELS
ncbi:MAG: hypothetical protein KGI27_03930 [Thaumarchaeota archaeon]|nr:hypothetical protein [Nitrososphaerota archaeon]